MPAPRRSQRLESLEATLGGPPTVDIDMTIVKTTPLRTLKRKAEENSEELEALDPRPSKAHQSYAKHETHWVLDDNVMLQMGGVRFKLHRSCLARESSWFQALFDKRSGLAIEGSGDWDEIGPVLEAVEVVDGCDLFYLDFPNDLYPKADDFAELLTALDNMVDYVKKRPDFPILARIFKAASFFRFGRYERYALYRIKLCFPDTSASISVTPIPHAPQAIALSRTHAIPKILRCAFYELARRSPGPITNTGVADDDASPSPEAQGGTSLKDLSHRDISLVLTVQKRLALSWKGIYKAASYTCRPSNSLPCKQQHSGSTVVAGLQMEQILDPIKALNELIGRDWTQDAFCPASARRVCQALTQARKELWNNMADWLEITFD